MTSFNSADLAALIERSRKLHVGMEDQFDRMWRVHNAAQGTITTNYPPYNIIKNGNNYIVEIAVAGFREEDIDIEVTDSQLTVQGKIDIQPSEDGPQFMHRGIVDGLQFMHRGIAAREFERKFVLSDDVVVNGAELAHGMLSIHLEHIVPESKKPRKIEINSSGPKELKKSSKKVQFLSE